MTLIPKQKQALKAQAHALHPVVLIGNNGLTENVKKEIDVALEAHELIKIRLQETDKKSKQETFKIICEAARAEAVQLIGKVGILYRESKRKNKKHL